MSAIIMKHPTIEELTLAAHAYREWQLIAYENTGLSWSELTWTEKLGWVKIVRRVRNGENKSCLSGSHPQMTKATTSSTQEKTS